MSTMCPVLSCSAFKCSADYYKHMRFVVYCMVVLRVQEYVINSPGVSVHTFS